jgi:hypothetical protein
MRYLTLISLLFVLGLSGCTTINHGNYLGTRNLDQERFLAGDAIKQLKETFPPAQNQLDLQLKTIDIFGLYLLENLRTEGYAVNEFKEKPFFDLSSENDSIKNGVPFAYVVDKAKESDFIRVTLLVGEQSLTRAYKVVDDEMKPAGYWFYRE